jgi:chromosome segregation ATPase
LAVYQSVKLTQNSRINDNEVSALLKIAKNYLPRVRLEYDRLKEEKSSLQAEINSWRTELNNIARTYQQFVDRNIELKKREDELQLSINELEAKKAELNESLSQTLHVPHTPF